jgi:hypothetical protein
MSFSGPLNAAFPEFENKQLGKQLGKWEHLRNRDHFRKIGVPLRFGRQMCRWLVYYGEPLVPAVLIFYQDHSLIAQSERDMDAQYTPGINNPARVRRVVCVCVCMRCERAYVRARAWAHAPSACASPCEHARVRASSASALCGFAESLCERTRLRPRMVPAHIPRTHARTKPHK